MTTHVAPLRGKLHPYSSNYGKKILLRDLNVGTEDQKNEVFLQKLQFEKSHKAVSMLQKPKQSDLH